MENEELNKTVTLANMSVLIEQVRVLEYKIDQLLQTHETDSQQDKIFGDWISEHSAIELTKLSRGTFLKLRKQGLLSSSSIAGKANYYKMSQLKELLIENEKNR